MSQLGRLIMTFYSFKIIVLLQIYILKLALTTHIMASPYIIYGVHFLIVGSDVRSFCTSIFWWFSESLSFIKLRVQIVISFHWYKAWSTSNRVCFDVLAWRYKCAFWTSTILFDSSCEVQDNTCLFTFILFFNPLEDVRIDTFSLFEDTVILSHWHFGVENYRAIHHLRFDITRVFLNWTTLVLI